MLTFGVTENIGVLHDTQLSWPPTMADEAIQLEPGTATQEAQTRKRPCSSDKTTARFERGVPQKRPRRATKETPEARGVREGGARGGGSPTVYTSLHSSRTKQACFVYPNRGVARIDSRMAGVEDVYLGENFSIRCVVTLKSSLIAMGSLVDGELRQRCGQSFRKRYGQKELQRRTVGMKR